MIAISASFISGCMIGLEFIWGEAVVIDLLILRIIIHYGGFDEE